MCVSAVGVREALGPFCHQTGLQNINVRKCAQGAGVTNNPGEAESIHTHTHTFTQAARQQVKPVQQSSECL